MEEVGLRGAVSIARMRPAHVPAVVDVHLASFPQFFLSMLGPRCLALLYGEILREHGCAAFVALDAQADVVGFVAGVGRQDRFFLRLAKRRWLGFGVASAGAALRRPWIIPRLLRALTHHRVAARATAPALLMSLAVRPELAGKGIGRQLVRRFLAAMKSQQVAAVSLTTDRYNNEAVNRFYQNLNFRLARQYVTSDGRAMNEYVIDLTSNEWPASRVA
jgi:ribosomal protein S18 acetylase RimI-like enzyme